MAFVGTPVCLIAAHGERGGARDNRRLLAIGAAAQALLPGADIRCGVLSGEPSIETVLADAEGRAIIIAPLFMCAGYFTETALPQRLAETGHVAEILPPVGETPEFVRLAAGMVLERGVHGLRVVAHGSARDRRSRRAAERFAAGLCARSGIATPPCAYLEEPPFAAEAVEALPKGGAIMGLFAGAGLHGAEDCRRLITESGRDDIVLLTPCDDVAAIGRIVSVMFLQALLSRNGANQTPKRDIAPSKPQATAA